MSELNETQLYEVIGDIAKQNLLEKEEVKELLKNAIERSFFNKFDPDAELEVIMDDSKNTLRVKNKTKTVVADADFEEKNRPIEIPLSEARKDNSTVNEGDIVEGELDLSAFERTVALQIKQMLIQSVKEKRKEAVYAKHKSLVGEMIDVTVTTATKFHAVFALSDGTTAFMPSKLRNERIPLSVGQRVKVYVEDVLAESKDAQIIVSNGSKQVIKRVLEEQVPEIAQGIVEIVAISRIPGVRSKVAVKSNDENVDPLGAVIGASGQRIRSINELLQGEKLDVINFSDNVHQYVANALSPAKIAAVVDKKDEKGEVKLGHVVAIAPNNQQTLAIGKRGSNVRLAVELTNVRVDVLSIEQATEKGMEFEFNLGLTHEDVAAIEAGLKPQVRRSFNNTRTTTDFGNLDDDIDSFNLEIEENQVVEEAKVNIDFNIDEDLFSEEDLQSMQDDFEFDEAIDYQVEANEEDFE